MAVPGSDDTGLPIAASVVSVGYFHSKEGLLHPSGLVKLPPPGSPTGPLLPTVELTTNGRGQQGPAIPCRHA